MNNFFIVQLIISFFVGGTLIALLTFVAERSSERVAGLVISLPSTVAISFFFIGWTLSPQTVAEIAPLIPIMNGVVMLFTVTYLYLSKIKFKKVLSIIICSVGGLLVWFSLSFPLAIIEFSNLGLSLIGYILLTGFAYYFITIRSKQKETFKPLVYSFSQKLFRAIVAGFIITLAVFLSKVLGPFWGGIFSSFPAAFLSSMVIIHWHYNSSFLFKVWKNTPLGSIIFIIYSITAIYTFPAFGIWGGTATSYLICLGVFLLLVKVKSLERT